MEFIEILKKKTEQVFSIDFAQVWKNSLSAVNLIEFLKKRDKGSLSIGFEQGVIKIVYMQPRGDNFQFIDYALKTISSIEDNRDELINFINNFLQKNSVLEKEVYLTISDPDSIIIKSLTLPELPREEIQDAAKWQLKDDLPFDLRNAIIDWQVVKRYTDEEGAKKMEIAVILAKTQSLRKYLSIPLDCNLNPIMVSSAPFNYANILRYSKTEGQIEAILDIDDKDTTLCIYKNKKLNFIRKLPFSPQKLTQSLTGALVSDKGRMQLSYKEAEGIKETFGIPQDDTQILKDNIKAIQVISLIRPHLESLVKETKRTFNYFISNFSEESPAIIYLTGNGSNLNNLDVYLRKELNANVSKLPIPECVITERVQKQRLDKDKGQIMNTLAAFLTDSEAVNLLPEEFITKNLEAIEKISLRLITIVVALIFLASLFAIRFQIGDYKKRLKNAEAHLQTIKQIKVLNDKMQLRENIINIAQKGKVPTDGILKVLSVLIPRDIILNELLIDQKQDILTFKGVVSMSGKVAESVLTEFMKNIEASSLFTEASLLSSERNEEVQRFEIRCDLVH